MAGRSNYLFPGFKSEMIAAGTLRNWLYRQTREMGIPMKPHNFRHGLATLYLRDNPSGFSYAAQLLGNSASVVRQHYAWIDHDKELAEVQQEVAKLAGVKYGTQ